MKTLFCNPKLAHFSTSRLDRGKECPIQTNRTVDMVVEQTRTFAKSIIFSVDTF